MRWRLVLGTLTAGMLGLGLVPHVAVWSQAESSADHLAEAPPFRIVREVGGGFAGLAVDGQHVFLGVGRRMAVLDGAESVEAPQLLGFTEALPDPILGIALAPESTLLAAAGCSLYVFDASSPGVPPILYVHELDAEIQALAANAEVGFVVAGDRLRVLLIGSAGVPVEVGSLALPSSPSRLITTEDLAFVGLDPVMVIDVRDPSAPLIMGGLEDAVAPVDMASTGHTLYVLDRGMGINSRGRPVPMGTRLHTLQVDVTSGNIVRASAELAPPEADAFTGLAVAAIDEAVYVTGSWEREWMAHHELRCWDAHEPARPAARCAVEWPGLEHPAALIAARDRLFHAGNGVSLADGGSLSPALQMADVIEPLRPRILPGWRLDEPRQVACAATIGDDFVYHEFGGSFHFYDGSSPERMVRLGYLLPDVGGLAIRVVGRPQALYALWADVRVYDVTDRGSARQVAASQPLTAGEVLPVMAVREPYVLVADGSLSRNPPREPGYWLVILTRSASGDGLERVAELVTGAALIDDIAVDGDHAYLIEREHVDGVGRLTIVDWSDPTAPAVVGRYSMPHPLNPKRILVRDAVAYVVARTSLESAGIGTALVVLDVTEPGSVRLAAEVSRPRVGGGREPPLGGQQYVLGMMGRFALVSGHEPVLRVVDLAGREPSFVQELATSSAVSEIATAPRHAHAVLENGESLILELAAGDPRPDRPVAYLPLATRD